MDATLLEVYQAERSAETAQFLQIDMTKEVGYAARFALFSANLALFLPNIPTSQHPALFEEAIINNYLETSDRNLVHISDISIFEGQTQQVLAVPPQQFIYCSFHLGSYRVFLNWLFRLQRDLVILVRQGVFDEQVQEIMDQKDQIVERYNIKSDVKIINADEPTSALKILRLLRAGYSLVAFMDANSGTGDAPGQEIQFLNHGLSVRKGLPFLSYAANIPILPVIAYRTPDLQNVVCVGEPIYPDKLLAKETFERQTLQHLYDWLAEYVQKFPAQWEVWTYINNFMLPPKVPALVSDVQLFQKTTYQFNAQRYMLFELEAGPVLFDRAGYDVNEISPDLFRYLSQPTLTNLASTLDNDTFQDLVANAVIV